MRVQLPKAKGGSLPARPVSVWIVAAITALAVGAAWFCAVAAREHASNFEVTLTVAFFIPLVASALCLQVLAQEGGQNNRGIAPLFFWLWLLAMPVGVYTAAAYLVAHMPVSYRGDGAGVWWGTVFFEFFALLMSPLLWFFVVLPLAMLAPLIGKVVRGERHPRSMSLAVVLLSLAGIIITAPLAFDYGGPKASFAVVMSVFGIPGGYSVQNEILAWVCRGCVLLLAVVLVDGAVARRRDPGAGASELRLWGDAEKSDAPSNSLAESLAVPGGSPAEPAVSTDPAVQSAPPVPRRPKRRSLRRARREPSALDVYDVPAAVSRSEGEASDGAALPPGAPKPPS